MRPLDHLRPAVDAEQLGHRRAVDVGVEQADLEPEVAQAERQVDRGGRLADAALAGGDGDDVGDVGDALAADAGGSRRPGRGRGALVAGRALGGQRDEGVRHAGYRLGRGFGGLAHQFPGLGLRRGNGEGEGDLAVRDDDVGQHARLVQRAAVRGADGGERSAHLIGGDRHGVLLMRNAKRRPRRPVSVRHGLKRRKPGTRADKIAHPDRVQSRFR